MATAAAAKAASSTCLGCGTSFALIEYTGATLEAAVLNPKLLPSRSFVFVPQTGWPGGGGGSPQQLGAGSLPIAVEIEQRWAAQASSADREPVHAVVWDAGVALCDWLCADGRKHVLGRTVLELGSGTGLVGIMAAKLGATQVVATDLDRALLLMAKNVFQNGLGDGRVRVARCRWGNADDASAIQQRHGSSATSTFDAVIGSDLVYRQSTEVFSTLLDTICEFLAPGSAAYLSTKFRANPEDAQFLQLAQRRGLEVEVRDLSSRRGVVGRYQLQIIRRPPVVNVEAK